MVLTGGTSLLPDIRKLASETLGMPVRLGRPDNLVGMVDRLHSPAFSTSVGLIQWAMLMSEYTTSPISQPQQKVGSSVNWDKIMDVLKRFLP